MPSTAQSVLNSAANSWEGAQLIMTRHCGTTQSGIDGGVTGGYVGVAGRVCAAVVWPEVTVVPICPGRGLQLLRKLAHRDRQPFTLTRTATDNLWLMSLGGKQITHRKPMQENMPTLVPVTCKNNDKKTTHAYVTSKYISLFFQEQVSVDRAEALSD